MARPKKTANAATSNADSTTKPAARRGRPPKTATQTATKAVATQPNTPKGIFGGDGPVRLSLACGDRVPEGFLGVDIAPGPQVAIVQDLLQFPWSGIPDNSVDEIECTCFVEHIPHGGSYNDPYFQFFDEIWRILKPAEFDPNNPNIPLKGFAKISCPYYSSSRAWWDPTHQRAISEQSFLYLNKQWRIDNKLDHYPVSCDFDFSYGYVLDPEWQNRNQEAQAFAIKHYINVVTDIQVQLVKRS